MSQNFWDFGFDLGAVQDNHTLSFLRNGIVQTALPHHLQVDDMLTFNVYDLSTKASVGGSQILNPPSINFNTALVSQAATTPFGNGPSIAIKTGTADASGPSAVFGGTGPNAPNFPRWTGTAVQINTPGHFLFTVALTILGPGANNFRTFAVDPEMIVWGPSPGGS